MPVRMPRDDIPEVRARLLRMQGGYCQLCGEPLSLEQAVLDHDHTTGLVRGTLHRSCNGAEGRVLNALRRLGIKEPLHWVSGMLAYHKLHADDQHGLLHPQHFVKEDRETKKAAIRHRKAEAATKKREAAKVAKERERVKKAAEKLKEKQRLEREASRNEALAKKEARARAASVPGAKVPFGRASKNPGKRTSRSTP